MAPMEKKTKIRDYIRLHIIVVILALGTVCSKIAAGHPFLSVPFLCFFGLYFASLAIYALFWQQILKRVALTTAFCNKSMTVVWGILFGTLFFDEAVTWQHLLGAAVVVLGVILVVTGDE